MDVHYLKTIIIMPILFLLVGCGGSSNSNNITDSKIIADNQNISLDEDTNVSIKLSVKNNESKRIYYTLTKKPSHGILTGDLPNVNYSPNKNYFGNDFFTYRVSDGSNMSLPATVKLNIKPINDKPIVDAGNDMNITIGSNATFKAQAADVDGHIIKYTWKENGIILSDSPNFSKNDFAKGKHTITLLVTDNDGAVSSDTLILKVGLYVKTKAILNEGRNIITYNLNEQPLINKYDSNLDGSPDTIISYVYDPEGHELNASIDRDADGIVDAINKSTYDSNGNKITYSYCNAEGFPYTTFTTTYNSFNKPLITKITDSHGTHISSIKTYDTRGNLLSSASDSDSDYTIDTNTTYSYDQDGKKLKEVYDVNNDGNPDRIVMYAYDINGNLSDIMIDNNADNEIDSIRTYLYNDQGNILSESYDIDNDGTIDSNVTYIYNEKNDLITKINDNNGDGLPDITTQYIYKNGNLVQTKSNGKIIDSYEWLFIY